MPLSVMAKKIPELEKYTNRGIISWDIGSIMTIIHKKNPNKDLKLHSVIGAGNSCTVILIKKNFIEKILSC